MKGIAKGLRTSIVVVVLVVLVVQLVRKPRPFSSRVLL